MSEFISTLNKGFRLTFDSGWEISVQWGYGNYGSNQNGNVKDHLEQRFTHAVTAEVLIITPEDMFNFDEDNVVMGWCTPECVGKMIGCISNASKGEDMRAALIQIHDSNK